MKVQARSPAQLPKDHEVKPVSQLTDHFEGLGSKVGDEFHVLKHTKWMTNSEELAKALDRWCTNKTGGPYQVHIQLIGGVANMRLNIQCDLFVQS